jgi:hypothetical protein
LSRGFPELTHGELRNHGATIARLQMVRLEEAATSSISATLPGGASDGNVKTDQASPYRKITIPI